MKKIYFISLVCLVIVLASCDSISPETSKAFVGEYWMETTNIGISGDAEYALNEKSTWTPVSIYEQGGKLYVQTELLGAPDFGKENPEEIEGTKEHPDFIPIHRILNNNSEEGPNDSTGIETVVIQSTERLVLVDGYILLISGDVRVVKTRPIKVKSGSETVLYLEEYKPVKVMLTSLTGEYLTEVNSWYEYGAMVKKDDVITWDVEYKDDLDTSMRGVERYDKVIHKNTLYKR